MRVDMVMPQMGESIAEGTIVRWTRQVGDVVARDENILDISTDKVDSEIPSPAAGKLVEIRAKEGETVPVGQVIAVIETEAGAAADAVPTPVATGPASAPAPVAEPPAAPAAPVAPPEAAPAPPPPVVSQRPPAAAVGGSAPAPSAAPAGVPPAVPSAPPSTIPSAVTPGVPAPRRDGERFYSPLVRAIARAEGIDGAELASIAGTGRDGRVTAEDLKAYLAHRPSGGATTAGSAAAAPAPPAAGSAPAGPAGWPASGSTAGAAPMPGPLPAAPLAALPGVTYSGLAAGTEVKFRPYPLYSASETRVTAEGPVDVVKMDVMRQRIAEHMVRSKATSPHVASVTEVDMTRIVRLREASKDEFKARHGFGLTYTSFILAATVRALVDYPMVNASVEGTDILVRRYVNLGVAVALDHGLIVPVIKRAEEKNLLGLARALQDLSSRARSKKLLPDEVAGGTFAVTNMGGFGNLFGIPIISQPNVGILGAGAIVKRPVVVGDAIAVRDIMYLSLSYDHRIVDGALGGYFIQRVRYYLERVDLAEGI